MNLSYQEKSIYGSLIATVVVYGRYFAAGARSGLIGTVVVLVIIQIACQIAIAIAHRPEPKDERDRLIESLAYRVGYLVLVTGTLAGITVAWMNLGDRTIINALLMALVAAEIAKSIAQLVFYRWGYRLGVR